MAESIRVLIRGDDIHHDLWLPFVPRKGEHLWLSSLTRGASNEKEVIVSKVEWAQDQTEFRPGHGVHVWLTVRRVNHG